MGAAAIVPQGGGLTDSAAEVAHLACLDAAAHGASGVLDRDTGVDAVLVKQVDAGRPGAE